MGSWRYFCKFIGIAILLAAMPATAQVIQYDETFNLKGIYEFTADGLLFGRLGIEAHQDAAYYYIAVDVQSAGVINFFTRHSSHSVVQGHWNPHACLICPFSNNYDAVYETHYLTKKKPRHVKLSYFTTSALSEIVEPPEDPAKRPPVPFAEKNEAIDPLSFLREIHNGLLNALKGQHDQFSIDVYDGRRVTRADLSFTGRTTIRYQGETTPVVALTVRRAPVAGFTDKERADIGPNEPLLTIYFRDDATLTPLKLAVPFWLGTLSATLVKQCTAEESCLLGNKE